MNNVTNSPAKTRIEQLLDANSFVELQAQVVARSTDFNLDEQKAPSDGVVIGHGLIDGELVFVYAQDPSVLNGTIGEMHAKKICQTYDMAMKMGAPIIGLIDCAGVRLQESLDALDSVGLIMAKSVAASGVIPQITAVFGQCGGGLAVLNSLSDFSYMEKSASIFVNSPDTIEGNRKEVCDTSSCDYQYEKAGNVDGVGSEAEILSDIRTLISVLPANSIEGARINECADDLNRGVSVTDKLDNARSYIAEIADANKFIETKAGYAKEMVTGFIQLNGTTIGVVANDNDAILSGAGCNKAHDFVSFCDAFEIPLLTLVNTNGYKTSTCSEKTLAKAAAKLASAFASATVPKLTVLLKDAVGSAAVIMNSKALGADLVYAYDSTNVGIMDANLAASIMYPNSDDVATKAAEFANTASGAINAAKRGYVDRIISDADTRKYIIAGFEMLMTKTDIVYKKHSAK